MAPKHPFPIPFQDCVDAALYFFEHATDYGVDPKRVALAGEPRTEGKPSNLFLELSLFFRCVRIFFLLTGGSAGGNLAATVAIKLRDLNISTQPKAQVIMFPLTQAMDFNLPSFIENEHDPLLYKELTIAMWLMYATGKLFTDSLVYYIILRLV